MRDDKYNRYWHPIVHSYLSGHSALPLYLGLDKITFIRLIHAIGVEVDSNDLETNQAELRGELMVLRAQEHEQLHQLLQENIDESVPFATEMATVISSGCMGSQHLWHDLGLPERPILSQLFSDYFPDLSALNVNNMRWKRFLYRQLCENGGDYVCRSPSCETCSSYSECFDNTSH